MDLNKHTECEGAVKAEVLPPSESRQADPWVAMEAWSAKVEQWGKSVTTCCQELSKANAALVAEIERLTGRVNTLETRLTQLEATVLDDIKD